MHVCQSNSYEALRGGTLGFFVPKKYTCPQGFEHDGRLPLIASWSSVTVRPLSQFLYGSDVTLVSPPSFPYHAFVGSWQVEKLEEVEELVVLGGRNRTVGNNNVNEHSSRSHLVLQVHITSTSVSTGYVQHGILNLIDLAGSERIKVIWWTSIVVYCLL